MESRNSDRTDKSRPSSRSCSITSRKNSMKNEPAVKIKSPVSSSAHSTPKKGLDFMVTGKQILRKADRANSLPVVNRPSSETKPRRCPPKNGSTSSKSGESLDEMSLDLSQITNLDTPKSGAKLRGITTSTPKKPRSGSVQSHPTFRTESGDSFDRTFSTESNGTSPCRHPSTEPPSSPGCSEAPSNITSRTDGSDLAVVSPLSLRSQISGSSNISSWAESNDVTKIEENEKQDGGEWNNFWANYNNSFARVPMQNYYDQCPTPYRTENIDLADLDISATSSRIRSPQDLDAITSVIRREGLRLTPRETQSLLKCAHILGGVLSKAIDRNARQEHLRKMEEQQSQDIETKKKNLTLALEQEILPIPVTETIEKSTITTQTDISLPFTKSAPRIFEKILRQLSRNSIDEAEKREIDKKEEKTEEDVNKTI